MRDVYGGVDVGVAGSVAEVEAGGVVHRVGVAGVSVHNYLEVVAGVAHN